jgi:transposase
MFQDEGRFGRVSFPRRSWAPFPCRPRCSAQIIREYIYAYSAISPHDGKIESLIAPRADADIMGIFLEQVSERFPADFILMVMDKAAWHTAKKLDIPENIEISFLPPYSPQLNPVEHLWKEVREKYFGNHVFKSIDAVEDQLMHALTFMNNESEFVKSFSNFKWINESLLYL